MHNRYKIWGALFAFWLLCAGWLVDTVQAQAVYVRAILFYSPTCTHCHEVMTEDLPPDYRFQKSEKTRNLAAPTFVVARVDEILADWSVLLLAAVTAISALFLGWRSSH